MLRELAGSLRRGSAGRDPVALFRQLSHQYASSSTPSAQSPSSTQRTASVDALRQRLADGEQQVLGGRVCSDISSLLRHNVGRHVYAGPGLFDFTSGDDASYSVPAPSWKVVLHV